MSNITNGSFMESFLKFLKKQDPKIESESLFGKIVGVDTKHKSSDGFNLVHIYRISDRDGKTAAFLGNIKYKSKMSYFRKNTGKEFIEKIESWRELSPSELKTIGNI